MAADGAAHAKSGVFRESLSPKELVADDLRFSDEDVIRLRRAYHRFVSNSSANSFLR
jgi:hypothetical protein